MDPDKASEYEKRTGRTKVTENGQATPMKDWRDKHDIEPGDDLVMWEDDDGALKLMPAN